MAEPLAPSDPQQIGGYRLTRLLGAGGMGRVFLGVSPGGRKVAVKLMHPEYAADPDFRLRFAREVAAARRVGGFFTAPVVDADPEADPPWMVTAYIEGPSLAERVAERGPLEPREVGELGAALAEGLAAIHACGLVHRDLKPGNIILARDGPRIIDFGIARAVDSSMLTAAGMRLGTPPYMSPEQVSGEPVGPESDVFSLGSVLTFAATGHSPFPVPHPAVIHHILVRSPQLQGLSGSLRDVITGCLQKDPASRPALTDVLARLASAGRGGGTVITDNMRKDLSGKDGDTVTMTAGRQVIPALTWPDSDGGILPATVALTSTTLEFPFAKISNLAFSPDGRLAAVWGRQGTEDAVQLVDVMRRSLAGSPLQGLNHAQFSCDGSLLLAYPEYWHNRRLIDTATGEDVLLPVPGQGPISGKEYHFSPNGRHLVGFGEKGESYLWDAVSREFVGFPFSWHSSLLRFSPGGRFLVNTDSLSICDISISPLAARHLEVLSGNRIRESFFLRNRYEFVAFSPNGGLAALVRPDRKNFYHIQNDFYHIQLWDTATCRPHGQRLIFRRLRYDTTVAFSYDGRLFAVAGAGSSSAGGEVLVRDVTAPQPVDRPLRGSSGDVWQLAFSPDGRFLAAVDRSSGLCLWDTATWQIVPGPSGIGKCGRIDFSPDGRILVVHYPDERVTNYGSTGKIVLWDTVTWQIVPGFGETDTQREIMFSPDGRFAVIYSPAGNIVLWDTATLRTLALPSSLSVLSYASVRFSPDSRLLVTADRSTLQLWDLGPLSKPRTNPAA